MELSLISNLLAKKNAFNLKPDFPLLSTTESPKPNPLLSPDSFFQTVKKNAGTMPVLLFSNTETGEIKGIAKATGYYPANNKMEGGFHDKHGKKLCTLQDFLEGKAPYVSIALDKNLYKSGVIKYGDKFRIPELEAKYHRQIEFRAVDTGSGFTGKKFSRVDICNQTRKDTLDAALNKSLTLIKVS